MRNKEFDVLIAGAGPAGCATALALVAAGIEKIALVDRAEPAPFIPGESATPDLPELLTRLGLSDDVRHFGHDPYYGNLTAWGGAPRLALFGRRGNGWHLDRSAFERWLRAEACRRGVTLLCPAQPHAVERCAAGWHVEVSGFGGVRAKILVDAGGRRAPLARRLGAQRIRLDTLVALTLRLPGGAVRHLTGYSFVEAASDGWWYAAQVPSGGAVVMFMTDHDIALRYRRKSHFLESLRETALIGSRLVLGAPTAALQVHAAHAGYVQPGAGDRWLAVGDALLTLDPLTSSGLSGAFNDAFVAARAIGDMLNGKPADRAYAQRVSTAIERYRAQHAAYYALERRWPNSLFWSRRICRQIACA